MRLGTINPGPERERLFANVNAREFVNRRHWNDWEPNWSRSSTAKLRGSGGTAPSNRSSIHSKCRGAAKKLAVVNSVRSLDQHGTGNSISDNPYEATHNGPFFSLRCGLPAWARPQDATLHVATRLVKPFVFEENRELTGFSLELWQEISRQMNVKSQFVIKPSVADILSAVKSNEVDLGIAAISITAEPGKRLRISRSPCLMRGCKIMIRRQQARRKRDHHQHYLGHLQLVVSADPRSRVAGRGRCRSHRLAFRAPPVQRHARESFLFSRHL